MPRESGASSKHERMFTLGDGEYWIARLAGEDNRRSWNLLQMAGGQRSENLF
jgi:hypothetical protein